MISNASVLCNTLKCAARIKGQIHPNKAVLAGRIHFIRIHKSLKVSPAMAAGVSDCLWSMEDIATAIEPAAPAKRGAYKKTV